MNKATDEMMAVYYAGKTVAHTAKAFGVSTGKMYKMLKLAGCTFRKKGTPDGWHPTPEMIEKTAAAQRGKKVSAETRKRISDARKSDFNGLNGYGHIKKHPRGYAMAYVPMHPKAQKCGYVMLHTVIMERHIGRYLNDDEVVHHKNHIRDDNRVENLALMKKADHMRMHMKERNQRRNRYQ